MSRDWRRGFRDGSSAAAAWHRGRGGQARCAGDGAWGRAMLGRDASPALSPTAACGCGLAQRLRRPGKVCRRWRVGAGRCSACLPFRDTEVTRRPSGRSGGRSRSWTRSRSVSSRSCAASGAPARYASACVSHRWLRLLAGIRASKAVLAPPTPAVLDLNMEYLGSEDDDDEADLMGHDGDARERTFEGKEATDARLMAMAVAGRLAAVFVCGSHSARGITDEGQRGQFFLFSKSVTRGG
ncbi:EIN3-binding F-box protein 1-like [Panicum miliaceum]|uniref:EIN3-binding F-box protein 1-like n=1 Tax=Panicum miliaceum TaxID=4540 RepID=A0A3L6PGA5_PANMI|nr:EIN3-binding F-box protein 1-like [Panicum miliaceum]